MFGNVHYENSTRKKADMAERRPINFFVPLLFLIFVSFLTTGLCIHDDDMTTNV